MSSFSPLSWRSHAPKLALNTQVFFAGVKAVEWGIFMASCLLVSFIFIPTPQGFFQIPIFAVIMFHCAFMRAHSLFVFLVIAGIWLDWAMGQSFLYHLSFYVFSYLISIPQIRLRDLSFPHRLVVLMVLVVTFQASQQSFIMTWSHFGLLCLGSGIAVLLLPVLMQIFPVRRLVMTYPDTRV